MVCIARVRWGTARFCRINEFTSIDDALAFVSQLRQVHRERPEVVITLERWRGDRWVIVP